MLPNLFVGSEDAARNLEGLQAAKITHILNVATAVPNRYPDVSSRVDPVVVTFYPTSEFHPAPGPCARVDIAVCAKSQRFTYRHLELLDLEDAPIGTVMPLALAFIRDSIADGGHVLVHWSVGKNDARLHERVLALKEGAWCAACAPQQRWHLAVCVDLHRLPASERPPDELQQRLPSCALGPSGGAAQRRLRQVPSLAQAEPRVSPIQLQVPLKGPRARTSTGLCFDIHADTRITGKTSHWARRCPHRWPHAG